MFSPYLGRDLVRRLSRVCRTKGAYTRLQQHSSTIDNWGASEALEDEFGEPQQQSSVGRPLAFSFEFIEIFGWI